MDLEHITAEGETYDIADATAREDVLDAIKMLLTGEVYGWLLDKDGNVIMSHEEDGVILHWRLYDHEMIADYFDESLTYSIGDYCVYDDKLYKFTARKDPGAWDDSVAGVVNVTEEFGSDISSLNSDISSLKSDVSSLNSDVSSLNSDVSSLSSDVSSLKSDVSGVSGLEIQRGSVYFSSVNASGTTDATVTFSKAFSGTPFVVCTFSGVSSVNYGSLSISTSDKSTTGFTMRLHNNSTSSSLAPNVNWIAIY